MPNDPPLNCPFSEHADRRAPAVRLTDDTVEFLEHRIATAVSKAWDDMLGNETVLELFSNRLFNAFIEAVSDEASKIVKTSMFGFLRLGVMAFIWVSIGYVLFGFAGMSAAFKASFGLLR